MPPLALIAGQGRLPEILAERLRAEGREVIYCAYHDAATGAVSPDLTFRLETMGSLLKALKSRGATEACFAGGIRRPRLDPRALDLATVPLLGRFVSALGKGDDGALRMVLGLFEERGMAVRAAHEILPDLLPPAGVLGQVTPDEAARADVARAAEIVAALGAADVGQGCVVARRQALAIEAMPGTDWMLETLRERPAGLPEGGVLYKAPKPVQDRRVDLPTIGPETIRGAAAVGLGGVALAEGGVMILDRPATIRAADEAGLFLWVRPQQEAGR